ncbi:trypco2 family protein [Cupriavidus basilensis]|uniref:trypco2 family protein n=1 Tax=Cupriavidus basilensis TaxID=68895 RepID=UPI00118472D3|nr:trypco2 family protein [Cupriavidus basilensis]
MATSRFCCLFGAGLLSACCTVQPQQQPMVTKPLSDVLKQISTQIAEARAAECEKHQRLGVYLSDIELTLGLTVEDKVAGGISVTFPVIGQLAPSGTFDRSKTTTAGNTLVIKFASIKAPKSGDPCDPNSTALNKSVLQ